MPDDSRARHPRAVHASALALAALLGAAACGGDSTGPSDDGLTPVEQRPAASLTILQRTPTAPSLVATTGTFYAKRGEGRELRLYLRRADGGGGNGDEYLRLRVAARSLDRRPDGTAFAEGDSVLITVTADPTLVKVDFQPSGLRFSAAEPAELKLRWAEAGDDLNRDGRVDGSDDGVRSQLAIWLQEQSTAPWGKLVTTLRLDTREAEARLLGFTGYAVAY